MGFRSIRNIRNLSGKRALARVDFNVPVKNGRVADDAKIQASLPTIEFLMKKKARVILVTHLGRPEGMSVKALRVDPVAKRLAGLLERPVKKLEVGNWKLSGRRFDQLVQSVQKVAPGDVVMLENVRFSSEEQGNNGRFAERLASLADIFVLDGFAVAHRNDASVAGVARFLPSYAGFLLEREIIGLSRVLDNPASPFVLAIGGAKMETKVPVINALLPLADAVLVGGGIANTVLLARGYGVGGSLVDKKMLPHARIYAKKRKIIQPVDVIVGTRHGARVRRVEIGPSPHVICKKDEGIFDIGPATVRLFAARIKEAQTIVWNGAMGYFEVPAYEMGTFSLARSVASRSRGPAFGVVGGGETVQSLGAVGMADDVDLVSTGGGAMLEFLAGKKLPGIEALSK